MEALKEWSLVHWLVGVSPRPMGLRHIPVVRPPLEGLRPRGPPLAPRVTRSGKCWKRKNEVGYVKCWKCKNLFTLLVVL